MKTVLGIAAALLVPGIAAAQPVVSEAYARSTNPKSGAAFMAIQNPGTTDCVLTAASTPAAERAELHTNVETNGVMSMAPIDSVTVPAGGSAVLGRGGDHVMLFGLTKPLKQGDNFNLTLDFGACGTVVTEVPLDNARPAEPATPAAAAGGATPAMDHSGMAMPAPAPAN